ncbi:MAG: hypothetical protein ACOH2K_17420 [Burkholderiaceae bacterium]
MINEMIRNVMKRNAVERLAPVKAKMGSNHYTGLRFVCAAANLAENAPESAMRIS